MIDLDELMRLNDAATPGPWKVATWYGGYHTIRPKKEPEKSLGQIERKNDAVYIVAACNAVPELVARIRELEEQRDWLAQTAANAGWHGVRVGKEYMIDQARIAVSRAQAEQHVGVPPKSNDD